MPDSALPPPLRQRWRAALLAAWWQPRAAALATALRPLAAVYGVLWRLRTWGYRAGWLASASAPVPVVVVGNLIVGGAGKTPTVIALVAALREQGYVPGVISRGYGGQAETTLAVEPDTDARRCGDEPLLIRRRTGAPVWVARRRIDAARALCAADPAVDVLISDDGLQHLALQRDAQLVVFDERGIGNGLLLPAGPLRQPLTAQPPGRTAVVYNAERPTTAWLGQAVQRRLAGTVRLAAWWQGVPATLPALAALKGRPLIAAAGIAAPQRFFDMLTPLGLTFTALPLPDHATLWPRPWPADAPAIVVTEKDAVKLPPDSPDADRIHVATLDFRLPSNTVQSLLRWLPPPRRGAAPAPPP